MFCSFASLSNSSCFVFLFQKKNEKKYCSSYSVFARAFSLTHTHTFRLQKIKVSRAKILKKLSLSLALRAIPAICIWSLSLPPKHLSLFRLSQHSETRGIEGKEDGYVLVQRAVVTSSQVGTHVRRCPRLGLLLCDILRACGWIPSLLWYLQHNGTKRFAFWKRKRRFRCGGVLLSMRSLSRPADSIPGAAARGNNDVSVGGLLLLQHCARKRFYSSFLVITSSSSS